MRKDRPTLREGLLADDAAIPKQKEPPYCKVAAFLYFLKRESDVVTLAETYLIIAPLASVLARKGRTSFYLPALSPRFDGHFN